MRRSSLSSPSQVPCHSSPSTQVTPVTKRLDSMVRRILPVSGSIWWILRSRYWPTHRLPSAQASPSRRRGRAPGSTPPPGRWRDRSCRCASRRSGRDACRRRRCRHARRRRSCARSAAFGIEGDQPGAGGGPDALAVVGHACTSFGAVEGSVFAHDLGGAVARFILGSVCFWSSGERSSWLRAPGRCAWLGAQDDELNSTQSAAQRGVTRSS